MPLRLADIESLNLSPMMQQYVELKKAHADCLLFFRLGDFYELFLDDALLASETLEIALTSRDCGLDERAPMCGVPYHAAKSYIAKLIEAGFKVAVCEQMEDPASVKGLVRREVIRIITPGTLSDPEDLEEDRNHYLVSVYRQGNYYGLAALELISGRFCGNQWISALSREEMLDEVYRYAASEILIGESCLDDEGLRRSLRPFALTRRPDEDFQAPAHPDFFSKEILQNPRAELAVRAASALLIYLEETQKQLPSHLETFVLDESRDYLKFSETVRRNLELFETLRDKKKKGSLFHTIDYCKSAMGRRMLRRWLERPLYRRPAIEARQEVVAALNDAFILRQELRESLTGLQDIERLGGKLALGRANARDLYALAQSLAKIPGIHIYLNRLPALRLCEIMKRDLDPLEDLVQRLLNALREDAPLTLREGGLIREGFDEEIDRLRELSRNGKDWIRRFEEREKEAHGFRNLKIGYNRVFGYYIEISRSNLDLVPAHYERKQTLANAERFFTPELKAMEEELLRAHRSLEEREYELFLRLREECCAKLQELRRNAEILAQLDVLQSLAELAERRQYCRPEITDDLVLSVREGRHPVVEGSLTEENFVPNDSDMDGERCHFLLLTGPNMSGKSTYMRQIAHIVILAQMGSFVPAREARIGLVDQIFTRIGAADDLGAGRSTFMVEMEEVATILREASPRSLLILDEIGRGTSTYDGLSIAWAVILEITRRDRLAARTLFATHYHELTQLEGEIEGLKNFHIRVAEEGREIRFLHRIEAGPAARSYGIEVAKLAGVPQTVINQAYEILERLEGGQDLTLPLKKKKKNSALFRDQDDLFSASMKYTYQSEMNQKLRELDINQLSPLQALQILDELVKLAQKGG